jgi:hypothetical protein
LVFCFVIVNLNPHDTLPVSLHSPLC